MNSSSGFDEYRILILKELERLNKSCEEVHKRLNLVEQQNAIQNAKAAMIASKASQALESHRRIPSGRLILLRASRMP